MKILIGREFSGVVRDAFSALGHDAWSCDLEPSEQPGPHIQGDVLEVLSEGWDLMIAHPPCTYLCNSGARWWRQRQAEQRQVIHPWEYGHPEEKKTHLWLRGLSLLQPSCLVAGRAQRCWRLGASKHRARDRSRTYPGIAAAMAAQWGGQP